MISFLSVFAISFFIVQVFYAIKSLERIADALEDFVYDDEEDTEESEVTK